MSKKKSITESFHVEAPEDSFHLVEIQTEICLSRQETKTHPQNAKDAGPQRRHTNVRISFVSGVSLSQSCVTVTDEDGHTLIGSVSCPRLTAAKRNRLSRWQSEAPVAMFAHHLHLLPSPDVRTDTAATRSHSTNRQRPPLMGLVPITKRRLRSRCGWESWCGGCDIIGEGEFSLLRSFTVIKSIFTSILIIYSLRIRPLSPIHLKRVK